MMLTVSSTQSVKVSSYTSFGLLAAWMTALVTMMILAGVVAGDT